MTIHLYTGHSLFTDTDEVDIFFPELDKNIYDETIHLSGPEISQKVHNEINKRLMKIHQDENTYISIFTNSEHVLNTLRIAKIKQTYSNLILKITFLKLNVVDNINGVIRSNITVNEKGELSEWPYDMFDQQEKDLATIFKLNRKV